MDGLSTLYGYGCVLSEWKESPFPVRLVLLKAYSWQKLETCDDDSRELGKPCLACEAIDVLWLLEGDDGMNQQNIPSTYHAREFTTWDMVA